MTPLIEVSNLTKRFGRATALDGLDLAVAEGEVHGFSAVPVEERDVASALVLIAIAGVGGVAAAVLARRRELTA